jgi:hypothetical protein
VGVGGAAGAGGMAGAGGVGVIVPCTLEPILQDAVINRDLRVVTVSGTLTLNGAPLPDDSAGLSRGTIYFVDQVSGDGPEQRIGSTGAASFSIKVFPGIYTVQFRAPGTSIPWEPLPGAGLQVLAVRISIDADQQLNFDLRVSRLEGTLTLAGAPIPDSPGLRSRGILSFVEENSGSTTNFDLRSTGAVAYSVLLFSGTYRVRLTTPLDAALQGLPPSAATDLANGLVLNSDRTFSADLRPITVTGEVTMNGQQVPDSTATFSRGGVMFTDRKSSQGSAAEFGPTGRATYSVKLFPGTYDIDLFANLTNPPTGLPNGLSTRLDSNVSLVANRAFTHNVRPVTVTGMLTLGGASLPDSPGIASRGSVTFTDLVSNVGTNTTPSTDLGSTGPATYSMRIFSGRYRIVFSTAPANGLQGLPANTGVEVTPSLLIDADSAITHDLHVVTVGGTLTMDGGAIPDSPGIASRGNIRFANRTTGHGGFTFPSTGPASYSVKLFAGVYDVSFSTAFEETLQALPPQRETGLAKAVIISGDRQLDYDLHVVTVTGTLSLGGAPFPDGLVAMGRGRVKFVDLGAPNSNINDIAYELGVTGPATFAMKLFKGSYDIFLQTPFERTPPGLPIGATTRLETGCVP